MDGTSTHQRVAKAGRDHEISALVYIECYDIHELLESSNLSELVLIALGKPNRGLLAVNSSS